MKSLLRTPILVGALIINGTALSAQSSQKSQTPPATEPSQNYLDQFSKAKFGHYTSVEEARIRKEQESSAFREEKPATPEPKRAWVEIWYRAKFGHDLPSVHKAK